MKVIFCLGNPGADFAKSRHNFGFFFANYLAETFRENWKFDKKFNAEIFAKSLPDGEKILVAKPQTFYNLVGNSARAIMDFYKLSPADFLVIHDEMDIPLGTLRTRARGSDAGNNGVKSLISQLGTDKFSRIRVGSGAPQDHDGSAKPPKSEHIKNVLGKISRNEEKILEQQAPKIREIVEDFARGEFEQTTWTA
jgi:PTH1 family peptidyl-tRNA hydrolase